MAKQCMIRREVRRTKLRGKYLEKRQELRSIINSQDTSLEQKELAQACMDSLPRDSSASRGTRRCRITGRSRGVYRIFGMCRNMIRIYAARGDIPGLHKASW
jgi:small subunit ribosomal protein S14